ncbi:hypothetical protein FBQ80_12310 [Candidatus Brocadia sp. AMX2]|nr:hypothetical protein [Candidatus Brocadia sp. AMX2]
MGKSRRDDMIIGKNTHHHIQPHRGEISQESMMPYHPYGVNHNCITVCYHNDIPLGLQNYYFVYT